MCLCLQRDVAHIRVCAPIQYFDTYVGESMLRAVSFRNGVVYFLFYGKGMTAPPNAASCMEDTLGDIGRC